MPNDCLGVERFTTRKPGRWLSSTHTLPPMVRSAAPLARGGPGPRGRPTDPLPRVTDLREAATCRRKPPPHGLRQPPPGWAGPVRHYRVVKRPARSVVDDHLRPGESLPGGGRPPRVRRTEHG
jgi:hypothetical protein